MNDIKVEGANCGECPLRNNAFFAQPIDTGADILLISSGPTVSEAWKGGFLRGTEAGKLVTSVANVHSIDRGRLTVTTAVKCDGLSDLGAADKRKAIAACSRPLFNDVDAVDPTVVVPLGGEAYTAVTGERRAISAARVGPARYNQLTETLMVPTVSPWACIQNESQFQFLVSDFAKLVYPAPEFDEPQWKLVTTEDDALSQLDYWSRLIRSTTAETGSVVDLTIDIEVAMEKDISFEHPDRYDMLCIGAAVDNGVINVFAEDALTDKFWKVFKEVAEQCSVVAHNGKFDLSGVRARCGKINLGFDTMLAHYTLDERTGIHGLKYLAQEYLGAPAYDDEITRLMGKSKDFGSVPKDILYKYNAYDIHCTRLLKSIFAAELDSRGMRNVHDFLVSISNMLQDIEHHGMEIDVKYLAKLDFDYSTKMAKQLEELRDYGGPDFNPNSWQQIRKFLSDHSVDVDSTAAAVLESVIEEIGKIAERDGRLSKHLTIVFGMLNTLLDYRRAKKVYGTYIDGTKQRLYRGRVHPTYLIHGTTTGRLSARNPNTQNIVRDKSIKRMFVSSGEDRTLVHADYSQAELRVLSYLARDRYFRDIFNAGDRDLFDDLIVEMFPGSIKELESPESWKEKRVSVKTVVYGLNYGRTEFGVAHGLNIEVEKARAIMDNFFRTIPRIVRWQDRIREQVLRGDDLVTPFGRRRRYSLITKQNKSKVMNEALAFMPQSTASDCTITAAIRIANDFERLWGNDPNKPYIINLVHDDIITDAGRDDADTVKEILTRRMIESAEEATKGYVKFAVDADSGDSWDLL